MSEVITTLVGELQARPGFKFVFEGPADVCYNCKLKDVCAFKLEPNTIYTVIEVLGKKHKCALREGWVVAAKVVESEVEAMIEAKMAIEGAIITFRKVKCQEASCPYYSLCQSPYVKEGEKYKILKVYNEHKMCKGKKMIKVLMSRVK